VVEAEPVAADPSGPEEDGATAVGGPAGQTEPAPETEPALEPEDDAEPMGAEVVTTTAAIGAVVGGGDPLYRVNDAPVILLIGPEPAWRTLEAGVEGTDVAQLELNLSVLGFDPDRTVDVDGTFTAETAEMVSRWQAELGVEETGSVALGSVVFLPRPVIVSAIDAQAGFELHDGSPVLQVHEEDQRIEAIASPGQRSMIELGDTAEVRLPDRTMLEATVEAIGPASAAGHEITLRPVPDELTRLTVDGATVAVLLSEEVASDVLVAPAAALVRTDTVGYAVQVVAGGDVTLAPVETGVTADRLVEVSGDGIESGTMVVAP
jgi:peptidoglycan hydrolase-like protein with peptidoglycan-binding domain